MVLTIHCTIKNYKHYKLRILAAVYFLLLIRQIKPKELRKPQ